MAAEAARPDHPARAGGRDARSPLVNHADDHDLDRDNINNIVVPALNCTLSKTVLLGWIRAAQKRS
ncbi:hypothetical protein [Bosea sp. (in: a-proteobacteria)]